VLSLRELKRLASTLSAPLFRQQLGPFALVQRPAGAGGSEPGLRTAHASAEDISMGALALLFEVEDLVVVTLPPLEGGAELVVGRGMDADLVVDAPSVSKRHARLRWEPEPAPGRCTLQDLGSRNGTFLNDAGTGAREVPLRDGDIVSFGQAPFWYLLADTLFQRLHSPSGPRVGGGSG
jgi:hypothetical protein